MRFLLAAPMPPPQVQVFGIDRGDLILAIVSASFVSILSVVAWGIKRILGARDSLRETVNRLELQIHDFTVAQESNAPRLEKVEEAIVKIASTQDALHVILSGHVEWSERQEARINERIDTMKAGG